VAANPIFEEPLEAVRCQLLSRGERFVVVCSQCVPNCDIEAAGLDEGVERKIGALREAIQIVVALETPSPDRVGPAASPVDTTPR